MSKFYGGVPALRRADFDVRSGEVHALVGENGAGKSTMIKILAGVVQPDGGVVVIDGKPVRFRDADAALARGLRFIHQELNIFPQMSVAENIFMGRPYPRRFGMLVDWPKLNRLAAEALQRLGISHIDPAQAAAQLEFGDRILVKIASAFADRGRIYVLDEPTAALSDAESERLFAVIKTLRQNGCAIVYVSHRLHEVKAIADRVTVLRDGATVETCATAGASIARIIELMTGRAMNEAFPPGAQAPQRAETEIEVAPGLTVRPGEILGLAALEGSGDARLLKSIMEQHEWSGGFAYVPRERRSEGLILQQSVTENTTLPHLDKLKRWAFFANRARERELTGELAGRVRLKSASLETPVWKLSGGNQQKVVFARAVAARPRVLLLEEPTRGVDVGAKYDIYLLLRELAAAGVAIVMSSSDTAELIGMTDRIAVMREGRIITIVSSHGLTQQRLTTLCFGLHENKTVH